MNSSDLFRKKSIEQIQADAASGFNEHGVAKTEGNSLRRTLGVFDLTMMGIAAIVGAGIFAMVGKAAHNGGPAVIFLFIFTALACAFSALCYAEFASRIPVAGSAYTYAYASFGELIAWIIGWDLIVEYAIGNIAVAISWSDYFTGMLSSIRVPALGIDNGINIPLHFTMDYVTANRGFVAVQKAMGDGQTLESIQKVCGDTGATINCGQIDAYTAWLNAPVIGGLPIIADLPALLITLTITSLVYVGIRESKFASNIMTVLKIAIILLVIFLGATYVQTSNWSPFAPNGVRGVMSGVAAVFFAYIGFDALSTTAEECVNPRRDLPRAMILSLIICTVLYVALSLVLTGMVNYTKLDVGDPLAFVFGVEGANLPWVSGIIAVSAVIALATVFLVFQIGQPRLWMAMSRDGLLPKIFSSIHPKFQTPWFATIITGFVVAIPALFMNLTEVTDLASIGTLFAFVLVCGGVLVKDKDFGSGARFVPYIDSRIFFIILFAIILTSFVGFTFYAPVYVSGVYEIIVNATRDLLTFEAKDDLTALDVFVSRIPFFVFIAFSVGLIILCFVKRLSLIPVLGLLSCTYLMTELGVTNWLRFGIWLLIGLAVYFVYGIKHSKLKQLQESNK